MTIRFSSSMRTSFAAALILVCVAFGFVVFATSARAETITLNSGTITLTDGGTTGSPPIGSWVTLPTKNKSASPNYFDNVDTTWTGTPSGKYTPINGSDSPGLELGSLQAGETEIFDPLTDFGATSPGAPFYGFTETTEPSLEFSGSGSTYTLVGGQLSGFRIEYGGGTYNVGTSYAGGTNQTTPLRGTLAGNAEGGTVTLTWDTALQEPGFSEYEAEFHLVGTYAPEP